MKFKESTFCISDINFQIIINENYYDEICEYMKKSINYSNKNCTNDFKKNIYYAIDSVRYREIAEKIGKNQLSEKIEYFKDEYCYRYYYNDFLWLVEENNEWIIKVCEEKICIYTSEKNPSIDIYLLRILRSIAYGYNEDMNMILLHGAALAYNNKGFVIIGEKGSGKTSLLMRMVKNKAILISNDRIFTDRNLSIIGFPQAVRVGLGTFENDKRMLDNFSKNTFFRKQDRIDCSGFKYLITMDEIGRIYDTSSIMKHRLNYVIIPDVKIDSNELNMELIVDNKKKKQIFDKICFTPIDESFRYSWIYDSNITIEKKIENRKIIWEKLKNKDFIKVSYGTELESKNIVDKIMIFVNQIEEKKN